MRDLRVDLSDVGSDSSLAGIPYLVRQFYLHPFFHFVMKRNQYGRDASQSEQHEYWLIVGQFANKWMKEKKRLAIE